MGAMYTERGGGALGQVNRVQVNTPVEGKRTNCRSISQRKGGQRIAVRRAGEEGQISEREPARHGHPKAWSSWWKQGYGNHGGTS